MAQETKKTAIEIAQEKYDIELKAVNEAISKTPADLNGYATHLDALIKAEDEYATNSENALFNEISKMNNPIIELIKAYAYPVLGHKEVRAKGETRVTSVDKVEKEKQVDLLKFCKFTKLDTDWQYTASRFNQLMCLRVATQLGYTAKEIREMVKSFYMQDAVRKIEMGETPTSNTQVCKLLQKVIDGMLPNEDDEGKKIYKCNNYDVAYLDDLYGKKDNKSRLTVKVSNDSFLRRILVDICYRLVTDGRYGVNGYKKAEKK